MIRVETLHHVAVCVTDIERSKHFYGVILGLAEIERPPFDFAGAWYEFGARQLHLIVHAPARTMRGTREIDGRDGHFAVRVHSYAAALAHLKAHGVECKESRDNPTPWAQIYITDPDGHVIELNAPR